MLNRLKTVARDIRINRAARRARTSNAALAPFVFRRARPATIIQNNRWHSPLLIAVRVEMTGVWKDSPADRLTKYSTVAVVRKVTRKDEVVERVVRRRIRIEAGASSPHKAVATLTHPDEPATVSAMPMIVRTPPTAATPVAGVSPIAESVVDLPNRQTSPAKLDLNAIDINRLTEQVVTAIDRRITARRERTGRY